MTHDPVIALARALRRQEFVRILLRSFSEAIPPETMDGYVVRFEGDEQRPTRIVVSASPPGTPDATERLIRVDRVAMVHAIDPDESRPSTDRRTLPAPPEIPERPSADRTVRVAAVQLKKRTDED